MGHFRRQVLLNSMKLFDLVAVMFAFGLRSYGSRCFAAGEPSFRWREFFAMCRSEDPELSWCSRFCCWCGTRYSFCSECTRRGVWRAGGMRPDILKATTLGTIS